MDHFADSFEALALRDDFQWLQQCLDASERGRKQLQHTVKQQQRQIAQLEAAVENAGQVAAAQAERQWRQVLQQKEREWMQEYDGQMQSLLRIIRHHERTHKQMEKQLLDARGTMTEKASSATQTDQFEVGYDENAWATARGDIDDRQCDHVCASQHVEDDKSRYGHSEVVQRLLQQLQTSTDTDRRRRLVPVTLSSNSETTFRSSILRRLRSRSLINLRPVPPTIVEENEDDVKDELEEKRSLSPHLCHLQRSEAINNLEERNQVLQGRLASQQVMLDQLLGSRFQVTTNKPSRLISSREAQLGATTKPSSHSTTLHTPLCTLTDSNRIAEYPLSPTAA